MSKKIYYTLIGSRETPPDIMQLMVKFADKACSFGYVGRSGGAGGADTCLEDGVKVFQSKVNLAPTSGSEFMEIYLPWRDFNGRDSLSSGYYTLPWLHNKCEAEGIASEVHPAWDKCSQGVKKLHTRNIYQLLGQDLKTASRFVLCWAKPKDKDRKTDHVQGGTGTAVKLGIDNGVEIINLYWDEQRKRIEEWVNK